jgi:hypothetical protein
MIKLYADLVLRGLKTIDEVPSRIRAQVQALVDEATNPQPE